jgi:hypothetical protein
MPSVLCCTRIGVFFTIYSSIDGVMFFIFYLLAQSHRGNHRYVNHSTDDLKALKINMR